MRATELMPKHTQIAPPAPVNGGVRWRKPIHDVADACFGKPGYTVCDPDAPRAVEPPPTRNPRQAEPSPSPLAPRFVSAPPEEGRVGEEYTYQAKAFHSMTSGFAWSVREGPPGMKVDRHTGLVSWTPEEGGHVRIVLHARSLLGPGSDQEWTVCVRKTRPVRRPTPSPRFREALRRRADRIGPPAIRVVWRAPRPGTPDRAPRQTTAPPASRPRAADVPLRI